MAELTSPPNSRIDACLLLALGGDRTAAQNFFIELLNGPLFVPERYQAAKLSDAPDYPNDFVNILGIKDKDRVIVPAFSRPEVIREWCGQDLSYKALSGAKIIELIPADWWLCMNPGQEAEKEMSPWEINLLRGGEKNIPEILQEIFSQQAAKSIGTEAVAENDCQKLRAALVAAVRELPAVWRLYILRELALDSGENKVRTILIGAELGSDDTRIMENVQEKLRSVASINSIGDDPVKVLVGSNVSHSLTLGIFKGISPFYSASRWQRLLNSIRGWLGH